MKVLFLISALLSAIASDAQSLSRDSLRADSSHFSFDLSGNSFFINNEFIGDFEKGYTLIGYRLTPVAVYKPFPDVSFSLLTDVLVYHGYEDNARVRPYLQVKFSPVNYFSIILGYLDNNLSHNLIEPIFNPERRYSDKLENGVQFIFSRPRFSSDLWLEWNQFILWGDKKPERMYVGNHSRLLLFNRSRFKAGIDAQFYISHRGGQIDSSNVEMQSLENSAVGLTFEYPHISLKSMFVNYSAMSSTDDLPYFQGWSLYNVCDLSWNDFSFTLGHWYGDMFVNFRGLKLFACDALDRQNSMAKRAVLFNKLYYSHVFHEFFTLKCGAESYFNLYNKDFEYAYMLGFGYNKSFIKKRKPLQ